VLYLQGGGAQISARPGIIDVSSMFSFASDDASVSLGFTGGQIGSSLRLEIFEVDFYNSGIDLTGTFDDVIAVNEDFVDWTRTTGGVADPRAPRLTPHDRNR